MTRGLRHKNLRSLLQGGWNSFKEAFVKQARARMIAGASADFKDLGSQYTYFDIDLDKRLISADGGEYKTTMQWQKDNNISPQKLNMMNLSMHLASVKGWHKVRIRPEKAGMVDTMIAIDGHPEGPFRSAALKANEKPTDVKQIAFVENEYKKFEQSKLMLGNGK